MDTSLTHFETCLTLLAIILFYITPSLLGDFLTPTCRLSVAKLNDKVSDCFARYGVQGLQYSLPHFETQTKIQKFCRWKPSIMKCMVEVIRPCSANTTHMLYNTDNFGAVIEGLCVDHQYTFQAYNDCSHQLKAKAVTCFKSMELKTHSVFEHGRDLEENLCSLYLEMADCLSLEAVDTCSYYQSQFLNTIFLTLYAIPECSVFGSANGVPFESDPFSSTHSNTSVVKSIQSRYNKTLSILSEITTLAVMETPRIPVEKSCSTGTASTAVLLCILLLLFGTR